MRHTIVDARVAWKQCIITAAKNYFLFCHITEDMYYVLSSVKKHRLNALRILL